MKSSLQNWIIQRVYKNGIFDIKTTNKNLSTSDLHIKICSCVNQQPIDIQATHHGIQFQYTRNPLRKTIPNRHSRNWLREANCYKQF